MTRCFLAERLADPTCTPADVRRLFFALDADLSILRQRLQHARKTGDRAAALFAARSAVALFAVAGFDSLVALARPLAALIEAFDAAEPAWTEDLQWLVDAAPRYIAERWPASPCSPIRVAH
jgi:hypothetical protein